jgi:hypothetical protein
LWSSWSCGHRRLRAAPCSENDGERNGRAQD